jgi:hypothetical protein
MSSLATFLQMYRLDFIQRTMTSLSQESSGCDSRSDDKCKGPCNGKVLLEQSSTGSEIQTQKKTIEEWDYTVIQMASAWH